MPYRIPNHSRESGVTISRWDHHWAVTTKMSKVPFVSPPYKPPPLSLKDKQFKSALYLKATSAQLIDLSRELTKIYEFFSYY